MVDRLEDLKKLLSSLGSAGGTFALPTELAEKLGKHHVEITVTNDPKGLNKALNKNKELKATLRKIRRKEEASKSSSEEDSVTTDSDGGDADVDDKIGALLIAVVSGNGVLCDHLLQSGVDVNGRGPNKATSLHIAVDRDKPDIVSLLLARNADVNAIDSDGDTPLMIAVMKKNQNLIRLLISRDANLKVKNKRRLTAADIAFNNGDFEALKQLEDKQKALQYDNKLHEGSVLHCTTIGSVEMIDYWLKNYPTADNTKAVNLRYKDGRTIAFAAALKGSMEIMELVDRYGGDMDLPDDTNSSPLFCASQNGHENIVKLLLSKGCDVNRASNTGRTALFSAIANNHFSIVKLLVEAGADVNAKDKEGSCPLACCVMSGSQEIFDYLLLDKRADPKVIDNAGHDLVILAASCKRLKMLQKIHDAGVSLDFVSPKDAETALLTACQVSCPAIVQYLIDNGCSVKRINKNGVTPVLRAAAVGDLETVKLLKRNGAELDFPSKIGDTAILVAAQKKSNSLVRYLAAEGCNVFASDDKGDTLASYAARTNNTELLELLKEYSVPFHFQDKNGVTPLMIAAMRPPNLEMFAKFLEDGCDHRAKNVKGDTALSIAAKQGSIDVVRRLIEAGADWLNITNKGKTIIMQTAKRGQVNVLKMIKDSEQMPDVNATDSYGRTAVHYAAIGGRLDALEFLVNEMKADSETTDNEKFTPFMLAVSKGHKSVAEKLIDLGADINLRNKFGENSTHLAVKSKNLEMLRYIGQKMCYLDQEDNQGTTPLMLACRNKNLEIVNFLLSKKCSIESVTKVGRQIVHDACESGSFPVAMRVINLGIPLDSVDCNGITALMLASQKGSERTARTLIDRKKELLHMRDASGKTALDYAIQSDRIKLVQLLIDAGCGVNDLMSDGRSSLLLAIEKCKKDDQKIVQLLIEHKARTDIVTQDGLNAAHLACKLNKLTTLKLLIEKGVPLDSLTKQGDSCLTLAMPEASAELIGLLIDAGLDKSHVNSHRHSAVSLACLRGDEEILSKVLPVLEKDIDRLYTEGNSLLHFAVEGRCIKLVDAFLKHETISPDVWKNDQETPLHTACRKGHRELAELLLKHGADVNAADEKGETPIFKAVSNSFDEVVQLLIGHGADLDAVNRDGVSVLAKAFYNGNRPVIKLLQSQQGSVHLFPEKVPQSFDVFQENFRSRNFMNICSLLAEGLSVNRRDGDKCLLQLAIMSNHDDIIDKIMKSGPDFRMKDKNGNTPLMTCIKAGRIDIAKRILQCCPEAKDDVNNDGSTVLHVAALCGKATTLEWLLGEFTNDVKDNKGRTALHLAALQGNERMYKILKDKGWKSGILVKSGNKQISARHFAVLSGNMNFVMRLHEARSLILRTASETAPSVLELLAESGQLKTLQWICVETGVNFDEDSFRVVRNKAFGFGNEAMATWMMDREVDMERGDETRGENALLKAANGGNYHLCRTLVKTKKFDLSTKSAEGTTLVQAAVSAGHEPLMRYFIELGCEADEAADDGDTPLMEALYGQNIRFARVLYEEFKCNLKKENKLKINAVHYTATTGNLDILEYLKQHLPPLYFDARNIHGDTPLMLAVLYSKEVAAKFLLENFKLDIDNQNETGSSGLHWAALSADKALVSLLLDHNAIMDIKDKDGATPLMLAVQEKSVDCVKLLLEKGASATLENNNGDSALALMWHSDEATIREIVKEGYFKGENPVGPISSLKLGHFTIKSPHYRDHFPAESSDVEQETETETDEEEAQEADNAQVDLVEGVEQSQSEAASGIRRRAVSSIGQCSAGNTTVISVAQSDVPTEGSSIFLQEWTQKAMLGRGGFGDAHEVITDLGVQCVTKTIRLPVACGSQQTENERNIKKLIESERNLQKLHHPNIVQFLNIMQMDFNLIVFMEYLPGCTLEARLDKKPLEKKLVKKTAYQIGNALRYIHEQRPPVIHRDLNCRNIMVINKDHHIKLIDFGLSIKLIDSFSCHSASSFEPRGSLHFMAPEIIGSDESNSIRYSRESDIWAFGCTIYQMTTGSRPYADRTNIHSVAAALQKKGAPALPDECSNQLKNFYSHCVARDRKDRKSAADLLRDEFLMSPLE